MIEPKETRKKTKEKQELKVEPGENNNNVIKIGRFEDDQSEPNQENEEILSAKIKKKKTVEKIEKKGKEIEKKNERFITFDMKIGEDIVLSNMKAMLPIKLKRKIEPSSNDIGFKKKEKKTDKLTYLDLGVDTPESFDYPNYTYVLTIFSLKLIYT